MFLIFDTETTGLPKRWSAPITDSDNWPRCIQVAWQLHDSSGKCIEQKAFIIKPDGFDIPYESEQIHGISTALAQASGVSLASVLDEFIDALSQTQFLVGHNVGFDINIMGAELHRLQRDTEAFTSKAVLDTCTENTATLCQLPGGRGGKFKLPTLTELYKHVFSIGFGEAHNATADMKQPRVFFLS